MNKKYNLKLDLQFRCNNSIMKFNQFDNNTSDFFMRITNGGNLVDIEKAIVVLATIKPSGKVSSQFIEVKNGLVYADLKPSMKDEIGTYTAKAMLILEDERVVTDVISYEVEEDKIFSLLNDSVGTSEEFTLLTDMLSRLSAIEISEEQRVINEAERILSEENRKIEEAKRVEAELIRQHEEADRAKYDATRESNENIRKINEEARISSENVRLENEANRIEQEANRVKAEQLRKDNYNLMTEDEERRRSEANAHKEAEVLRVQAETNRVNEEAKRRTTEQARVSAENTRVSNENTRKANETTRQTNETHRVEAETQRQNRYNSFILEAEANANNFENYTNTAKVKEEERKSNELDRKSQEDRRVSNEVERISNENTRKANEKAREKNETSRQYVFENKVNEVDKKIIEINATKDNFVSSINTKVDTKISELNTTKDNFVSSVNTKVDNKISELDNAKSDMTTTVSNKVNEVETRFNALTTSQQQDAEVIDARVDFKGVAFNSLKERIDYTDKLLRNSTVSTVTTESGFTTVEATSNGYFEDVKLEGKTLLNLVDGGNVEKSISDGTNTLSIYNYLTPLKNNTLYTVILNIDAPNEDLTKLNVSLNNGNYGYINKCINGISCFTLTTNETPHNEIWVYFTTGSTIVGTPKVSNVIVLEGDHTQNPPSGYIEGLKSVGQSATTSEDGVDEIVVSSVKGDGNLIDLNNAHSKICTISNDSIIGTNEYNDVQFYVYLEKGMQYFFNSDGSHDVSGNIMYGMQKSYNASATIQGLKDLKTKPFTFIGDTGFYTLHIPNFRGIVKDIQLVKGTTPKTYTPHQSDKKRLLYYNEETQTWEKPILRQLDSIEKHANGKYYYHQRSGEEDYTRGDESVSNYITDMTTTVKPLAEEKVYECTNIDLITYANETNFIVESGVLSPKTTLKVHSNISNVVSLLQKKVSLLESNVTSYMITQNRLMLASRYNADTVSFKVDVASFSDTFEYDNDLYELILNNILVGKDNYNREYIENLTRFYWMDFVISDEMYSTLFEIIEEQHNPKIEKETPLI